MKCCNCSREIPENSLYCNWCGILFGRKFYTIPREITLIFQRFSAFPFLSVLPYSVSVTNKFPTAHRTVRVALSPVIESELHADLRVPLHELLVLIFPYGAHRLVLLLAVLPDEPDGLSVSHAASVTRRVFCALSGSPFGEPFFTSSSAASRT